MSGRIDDRTIVRVGYIVINVPSETENEPAEGSGSELLRIDSAISESALTSVISK